MPLPTRPGHVHAYVLPGDDGWTLVDTGLGLPDAAERWAAELDGLEVARIVVTHFHPDHVGAAADLAELTGAPVLQGQLDYAQCELVWGNPGWPQRIAEWFLRHGVPRDVAEELLQSGSVYAPFIRYQRDPQLVRAGDRVDGWELLAAPGHADGQLVPAPRRHPRLRRPPARPDLADRRPLAGEPARSRSATTSMRFDADDRAGADDRAPGPRRPGRSTRSGRARELIEHHRERLAVTAAALGPEPRTGYDVSFPLFGDDLKPAARRFAVAETLSHLERLVQRRTGRGGTRPTGPSPILRRRRVVEDELPPSTRAPESGARP